MHWAISRYCRVKPDRVSSVSNVCLSVCLTVCQVTQHTHSSSSFCRRAELKAELESGSAVIEVIYNLGDAANRWEGERESEVTIDKYLIKVCVCLLQIATVDVFDLLQQRDNCCEYSDSNTRWPLACPPFRPFLKLGRWLLLLPAAFWTVMTIKISSTALQLISITVIQPRLVRILFHCMHIQGAD